MPQEKEIKEKKLKFYWHIHHDVLCELLTESLKNRIKYIKKSKPKDEVKLRLKLLKPIKGKLPKEFVEAWQKCEEAWQKYDEAWQKCEEASQKYVEASQKYYEAEQKYDEAGRKYDEAKQKYYEARQKYYEAGQKYLPQLEALHKKDCGCGWNGKTIFTKENGLEK